MKLPMDRADATHALMTAAATQAALNTPQTADELIDTALRVARAYDWLPPAEANAIRKALNADGSARQQLARALIRRDALKGVLSALIAAAGGLRFDQVFERAYETAKRVLSEPD